MEFKLLVVCFFVSAYAQNVPPSRPDRPKPGGCPWYILFSPCRCRPEDHLCDSDRECPGFQKCCGKYCGCRRSCVTPLGLFPDLIGPPAGVNYRIICYQPKVVGSCRAAFRRWWYNRRTNRCERFNYGGCGGNQNNFKTRDDCERQCRR